MPDELKSCPGHPKRLPKPYAKQRAADNSELLDGEGSDYEDIQGLIKGTAGSNNDLAYLSNDRIGQNIMNAYQKAAEPQEQASDAEDEVLIDALYGNKDRIDKLL